jgi:predicted dehydrogenase
VKTLRLGIVGAGLMGRELASAAARWIHLLDVDFRPEIVAVCDLDTTRLEWFAERVVPRDSLYTNVDDLLSRTDVDAVYCAVPHNLHEDLYCQILAAGKHLFGEKPFGIDAAANASIVAAAAAAPELVVRCSSEFPFWPGALRVVEAVESGRLGRVIEVRAAFLHSSDLDPGKPINWKRMVASNGQYGVLGDLGMHVLHLPIRLGWRPDVVFAVLSNIVTERPDASGELVPCETWDNALVACREESGFPMLLEVKRIAPGEMDTWSFEVIGDRGAARFTTKHPRTFWTLDYVPGGEQSWAATDIGYRSAYPTITGEIFEFGFTDAVLQMLAAFCDEVVNGDEMTGRVRCATLEETQLHHAILTAALESGERGETVRPTRLSTVDA